MNHQAKEGIILRIISGEHKIKVFGEDYIVINPSREIKDRANQIYNETIKKNRFEDAWLSEKVCLQILVKNGLCSFDVDENLKKIEKEIENLKVNLYTSILDFTKNRKTRAVLDKVKVKQEELINTRHCLDHLTLRGFAEMSKRQFLIANTVYDESGNLIKESDSFLLEKISNRLLMDSIDGRKIREISRTEPWRTYWNIKKDNIFERPVFDLTDEQKTLILYSKMYDSAYEHPECPSDEVIKDDDAFDGWMIFEQRKREKEKKEAEVDKTISKSRSNMSKADELFVRASKKEDIESINNLNDMSGKMIKQQRNAVIKQKGKAVDANFMDRQAEIRNKANKQFMETIKGKK